MPVVLEMFLSLKVLLILAFIYVVSTFIVVYGFKWRKIYRRFDVKLRASIMLGTFIFLSQSIGLMAQSIMYLFIKINQVEMTVGIIVLMVVVAMVACDIIYVFISNYLWDRLVIESQDALKISITSLVLVTPWYFLLELFY